jgi:hypothetical protein
MRSLLLHEVGVSRKIRGILARPQLFLTKEFPPCQIRLID